MSAVIGVPAMAAAVTLTTAGSAYASGPTERAVVVLSGGRVSAPGVRVLSTFYALHLEVVEGTSAAIAQLSHRGGVAGITPDVPIRFMSTSDSGTTGRGAHDGSANGPSLPTQDSSEAKKQGGVYATDGLSGKAGGINAGAGVDVAIIDTGVSDTTALNRASGRLIDDVDTSPLTTGGNIIESGRFTDGYGHGTFMANIIAGGAPNGKGRALGVAPAARVHVVKVADDTGQTSLLSVLAGLNWVATHADVLRVANLALGSDRPMGSYGPDPLNVAAEWVRAAGVNVVVAAGNSSGQVTDPGFTPGVITVGAADLSVRQPTVAPFSGYGVVAGVEKPDVVASGVSVLSLLPADSLIARNNPQSLTSSGLYRGSGTSQATAVVSGLAANFIADHPGASTTVVKSSLRAAAKGVNGQGQGAGLAQTVRTVSESAGDGEDGFDPEAFLAGAYSGDGFTITDWLTALSQAWFDDASVGADWASGRWSSGMWSSGRWSSGRWSSGRWSSGRWSSGRWSSGRWSSGRWSSGRWSSGRWSSNDWVGIESNNSGTAAW
jgi:serine protease AprX